MTVRLCLDVSSRDIVVGFKIAQRCGWLSPDNALLVDLRHFIGSVEWGCVRELRELAPWIDQPNSRSGCAYLLEMGDMRRYLINVTSALYPAVQHRSFTDEKAALDWLVNLARQDEDRLCLRRA